MNAALAHPFARFLLQLLIILMLTRAAGWLLRKAGQPAVIGEIAAGILLGPSVCGALWPAATGAIFPKESLGTLGIVSEMGLVLFMFVIGIELDAAVVRKNAADAHYQWRFYRAAVRVGLWAGFFPLPPICGS